MTQVTRRGALALAAGAAGALAFAAGCDDGAEVPGSGDKCVERRTVAGIEPLDPATTAGWDANYYVPRYATAEEACEAGNAVALEVERNGIVLMANDGTLPLAAGTRVSLLGRSAADTVFGGTGAAQFDTSACVSLAQGLTAAGLEVNAAALDWIAEHAGDVPRGGVGRLDHPESVTHYIGELSWSSYPAGVIASLAGTVGVVVLGRPAFEGHDLSQDLLASLDDPVKELFVPNAETEGYVPGQHQLELTREERDLLAGARAACESVVVLLDCGTSMEVAPLVEEGGDLAANAIVHIGLPGGVGATAVGEVLAGLVNPSGRTCDLWAADFSATPSFANFGDHTYTDVPDHYTQIGSAAKFVEYREGIYVGYRYYETADAMGTIDYDAAVVFPFGHGLSYTTFDQQLVEVRTKGGTVTATVRVANSGRVAGREVVQCYVSAPWKPGQVEKSAVVLAAFAKTAELAPGESVEVRLDFGVDAFMSFDASKPAWVLDAGSYEVSIRRDSHTVIDSAEVRIEAVDFARDLGTGAAIKARFADCDEYLADNCEVLARANMASLPAPSGDRTAAECGLAFAEFDPAANELSWAEMPVTGEKNGVSLIDLRGRAMDDPLWQVLLDQLETRVAARIVSNNIYGTDEIPAIGKPRNNDADGPAGIAYMEDVAGHTAYPSEYAVAQTWDVDLVRAMGEAVGEEGLTLGINGWCAPAINCHRSPFGGRNFEYYSEDPLLAGTLACAAVEGAGSRGMYCQLKHFCLNDQDTNRCAHICTWASEQAIREIYARPFEIVVKGARRLVPCLDEEGNRTEVDATSATAIMSSYNYVGATWAGGRESLVTGLLRDEWGYEGYVVSDWSFYDYMDKNQAIIAGTDINFTQDADTGKMRDATSATAVWCMRRSLHHLLYTIANSSAMNGMAPTVKVAYETRS